MYILNRKSEFTRIIAEINYRLQNYPEVLKHWNEIGETNFEKYYWAKYFASIDDSEKLNALRSIDFGKVEQGITVQDEIENLTNRINSPEQIILTGNYFNKHNRIDMAFKY